MINFLHTFHPAPILLTLGPVNLYWYGFFVVLGAVSALITAVNLAKRHGLKSDTMIDLGLWLVLGGLIGARLYDVLLNWPYFFDKPWEIIKVWQGGLAIHGAILGGLISLWLFTKKNQHNFWLLAAISAAVLPLAQTIGRWGNYFNQELFGRPTNLPFGIPIDQINRPLAYYDFEYFHPAFLYESLGNLMIFSILLLMQIRLIKQGEKQNSAYFSLLASYLLLYSLLRFFMEFVRADQTPMVLGLRLPQIISLLIIVFSVILLIIKNRLFKKTALEK